MNSTEFLCLAEHGNFRMIYIINIQSGLMHQFWNNMPVSPFVLWHLGAADMYPTLDVVEGRWLVMSGLWEMKREYDLEETRYLEFEVWEDDVDDYAYVFDLESGSPVPQRLELDYGFSGTVGTDRIFVFGKFHHQCHKFVQV